MSYDKALFVWGAQAGSSGKTVGDLERTVGLMKRVVEDTTSIDLQVSPLHQSQLCILG